MRGDLRARGGERRAILTRSRRRQKPHSARNISYRTRNAVGRPRRKHSRNSIIVYYVNRIIIIGRRVINIGGVHCVAARTIRTARAGPGRSVPGRGVGPGGGGLLLYRHPDRNILPAPPRGRHRGPGPGRPYGPVGGERGTLGGTDKTAERSGRSLCAANYAWPRASRGQRPATMSTARRDRRRGIL